ncbi:hypothetical protein [Amorphus coralli]|uniref:hypothetical protein n=1 Tax=Amorphus coralli TaxID=340680 RepID=UPI0012EC0B33|nr:hypothetical protein [Amorphus coralli]
MHASFTTFHPRQPKASRRRPARIFPWALAAALTAPLSPAIAGDNLDDMGSALERQQESLGPVIGGFECQLVGSVVLGLPAAMSNRPQTPDHVSLAFHEAGSALLNGTRLEPSYRSAPNEEGLYAYPLRDVLYAAAGIPVGRELPNDPSSSGNTMQDFSMGQQLVIDLLLSEGLMAGRNRFMIVSFQRDAVYFVDVSDRNEIENPTQADCYRSRGQ